MVQGVPADRRENVRIPLKDIEGSPGLVPGLSLRSYFLMNPENLTFYVYILKSCMDGSYYIGQCHDLDKRMSTHADGLSKYTASKRPLRLVYFEACPSRSHAIKRENQIKAKKSRKHIEFLISNRFHNSSL